MKKYNREMTPVIYGPSSIKILHYNIEPHRGCFRTHWHERVEILRIRKGEIFVGYDTNIRKVVEGQVVILPPGTPHKGFAGDYPLEYDVFMFDIRSFYNDTEVCKKYFPAIYDGRVKFKMISSEKELVACLDKLWEEKEQSGSFLEMTADIYRLIGLLLKYCMLEMDKDVLSNQKWKEIVKYVEENSDQNLTTSQLSKQFNYSEEHFCRKFKAITGLTPMKYLNIFRVEKGYRLIKDGERDISKIAGLCGFNDSNYFTRCFKAHFGVPPSNYFVSKGKSKDLR